MIKRFYVKGNFLFDEIDIDVSKPLIIFTGHSGAGKSVLIRALLSVFGLKDANSSIIEIEFDKKIENLESFGIKNSSPNVIKLLKTKNVRYFLNNQSISKNVVKKISKEFINYLSSKEVDEFKSKNILQALDNIIGSFDKNYQDNLNSFKECFNLLKQNKIKLLKIKKRDDELKLKKETIEYEISFIDRFNPKEGEYEKLVKLKKDLSKADKIKQSMEESINIFEFESFVANTLTLLEEDSSFFDDSMAKLKEIFQKHQDSINKLQSLDIEELLDKIENLSKLKDRYGSIDNALFYKRQKEEELLEHKNNSLAKDAILKDIASLNKKIQSMATYLHKKRKEGLAFLEKSLNHYLKMIYLGGAVFDIRKTDMFELGFDRVDIKLSDVDLNKISSGELNRLKIAYLASINSFFKDKFKVLVLDEVDANLSGKEAMSIAKILTSLSSNYQIFAISHKPQLSSKADIHFNVDKDQKKSKISILKDEDRVLEIAKMVSSEEVTQEAIEFAKNLLAS